MLHATPVYPPAAVATVQAATVRKVQAQIGVRPHVRCVGVLPRSGGYREIHCTAKAQGMTLTVRWFIDSNGHRQQTARIQ